jgi:RNA polymerase sigma factor (sigma-70 family)
MDDWQAIQLLVEQVQDCQQWTDSGQDDAAERLEQAQESLYSQLRPLLHRIIRRLVRNSDDAEDILQEVLILVVGKLRNYDRHRASFRYWVERVAIHEVYHYLRSQYRRFVTIEADLLDSSVEDDDSGSPIDREPSPDPTPDVVSARRERLRQILACARASLDEEAYTVWYEYLVNGTTHEQIALLMNRRVNWVRQTLHRARLRVAAAIVSHPAILNDEEIRTAIKRCQMSENPEERLTEEELDLLSQLLLTQPRQSPGWRQINLFRQACLKILTWVELCLLALTFYLLG